MKQLFIKDISELPDAVQALLKYAEGRKKITFIGEIGAGKTTFIKAFCQHFQVAEHVTSPTFSLVNEYTFQKEGQQQFMYHLDLYRLKNEEEAIDIGIENYLYDDAYCLIEWPQVIENLLPEEVVQVEISIIEDSTRKMLFL